VADDLGEIGRETKKREGLVLCLREKKVRKKIERNGFGMNARKCGLLMVGIIWGGIICEWENTDGDPDLD